MQDTEPKKATFSHRVALSSLPEGTEKIRSIFTDLTKRSTALADLKTGE